MPDIRQLLLATSQAQANTAKSDAASPCQQEPDLRADSPLIRQDITNIAVPWSATLAKTLSPVDKGFLDVTGKFWRVQLVDRLMPSSKLVWQVCIGVRTSRYLDTKPVLLQHCVSISASHACTAILREIRDSQSASHPPRRLDILQDNTACFITFAKCNAYTVLATTVCYAYILGIMQCTCCETLCRLKCSMHAV